MNAIKTRLHNLINDDFVKTIDSVTNTISSLACLVRRAEETVEKLSTVSPPVTVPDESPDLTVSELTTPDKPELDDSVIGM